MVIDQHNFNFGNSFLFQKGKGKLWMVKIIDWVIECLNILSEK